MFDLTGHGSRDFNITTIDGVPIADFNTVTIQVDSVTTSGAGSSVRLGLRLSEDGGSTWINGATDYKMIQQTYTGENLRDDSYFWIHVGTATWNHMVIIDNLNAAMPTRARAADVTPGHSNPIRFKGMNMNHPVEHNAFMMRVASSSGVVYFNGGTLEVVGYR